MLLLKEARLRNQLMRPMLLEIGLTPGQGQARILDCVLAHEHLSQRALADLCGIEVTTMSRTIDRMVEAGYLVREVSPESRRTHCIGLTETGREKAVEARRLLTQLDELIAGSLNEEEQGAFYQMLSRICDALESARDEKARESVIE